jgi:heme o synthase
LRAYAALAKPRITIFLLFVCACGFWLGARQPFPFSKLLISLLATASLSAGVFALNQYLERDIDALMRRTAQRPLPAGVIRPVYALLFAIVCIAIAEALYSIFLGPLIALLGATVALTYDGLYTPMKRYTWWSVAVGAIPGALPPVVGFAAARGKLDSEALLLFAILFLWQFPHFHAIATLYRTDYALGGIRMLPVIEEDGKSTARQMLCSCLVLLLVTLLPFALQWTGWIYLLAALALGGLYLASTIAMSRRPSISAARNVLRASILYLPLLLTAMLLDSHGPIRR